ncbi:MAG: DUF1499 domain-containing protein [Parvularculaceae bacterium]|nr:DUF1499 domain-containing protein [Parvularculaceae bacterium]
MRHAIHLVAVAAVIVALPILAAGPGTRFGLWDYAAGLGMIRGVSTPKAVFGGLSVSPLFFIAGLSLALGAAGFFTRNARAGVLAVAAAAFAFALGVIPLKMKAAIESNPFIHEITTDFDNPPAIVAAAGQERVNPADYRGGDPVPRRDDGQTVAEAQREAFPDIRPLVIQRDLKTAADLSLSVIKSMGMDVLAEGPADNAVGGGWRIEAVATSFWFGFKDDFVVRLTMVDGGATRIDIRSKSRVGKSDLGANAARVREFEARFRAKI